jgi:hypothetical protein
MRLKPAERLDRRNSVEARLRNRAPAVAPGAPLPLDLEAAEEIAVLRTAYARLTTLLAWSHGHHMAHAQATNDWRIGADWNWQVLASVVKAPGAILEFDLRRPTARPWAASDADSPAELSAA